MLDIQNIAGSTPEIKQINLTIEKYTVFVESTERMINCGDSD